MHLGLERRNDTVGVSLYMVCEPHNTTKTSGFLAGSLCFGEKGNKRRVGNRGRREEKRKEGKGKERREEREDKEGWGGGREQRGREERGLKGSEEERKRLVRVWWFWGNSPPRRLLAQGVRIFVE